MKDDISRSFRALFARTIYATANFFVSVFDNALSVHLERLSDCSRRQRQTPLRIAMSSKDNGARLFVKKVSESTWVVINRREEKETRIVETASLLSHTIFSTLLFCVSLPRTFTITHCEASWKSFRYSSIVIRILAIVYPSKVTFF